MTDPADNVFKISGDQVNTGFEAIVTGRVTERLLMFGGFTVVDPTLTKTGNPLTDGKQFVNIPTVQVESADRVPASSARPPSRA